MTSTSNLNFNAAMEDAPVLPAARVWDQPCPTDLAGQKAFFEEHGFLILRGVLGPEELAELDRELQRIARDYQKLPSIREGFSPEKRQDPTRPGVTFRKIGGIAELSPAFDRLMRHPRIMETGHALMGPEIHLFRDVVMMKPARTGREKPWHQDSVYWPYRPMALVSAMTALDDATPENGCLQVIPGTHRQELQHYGAELRLDLTPEQQAQTCYVPLKAGDTLLFHSLLLHGSEPNTSAQDRRVVIFSYKPAGLTWIRDNPEPEPIVASRR